MIRFAAVLTCLFLAFEAHAVHPDFLRVRPGSVDIAGTHGMLVVGGRGASKKVLLSHLPMFMAPHDRQALFEATLDPRASAAYLDANLNPRRTFYTLDPGQFVLPTFLTGISRGRPAVRPMNLFTGIFDRRVDPNRGIPILGAGQVTVEKLLYGDIIPSARVREQSGAPYVLVRLSSGEHFLVHRVTAGGNEYDQFIEVRALDAAGVLATILKRQSFVLLTAPDIVDSRATARAAAMNPRLRLVIEGFAESRVVQISTGPQAYFFTDDLNQ